MPEFPICKTDSEKDNSFNEFSSEVLLILCSLLKILLSEVLLCITEFSEFYPLEHYKISLLLGTEIL